MIVEQRVSAVHDVSDGGVLVAIAEMAMAGNIGAELDFCAEEGRHDALAFFSEWQGCYVVTTNEDWHAFSAEARQAGVNVSRYGTTHGDAITFVDDDVSYDPIQGMTISLADLRAAHEGFFPRLMGADAALA